VEPLQTAQVAPAVPQALSASAIWHAPFESQQPEEQFDALQLLAPPQDPNEQVLLPAHGAQTLPAVPQAAADWFAKVRHVPFALQQPLAQLDALQMTPLDTQAPVDEHTGRAPEQTVQAAPFCPQAVAALPAWHSTVEEQHPVEQLAGLHPLELLHDEDRRATVLRTATPPSSVILELKEASL
jgi:hypothetical protein